MAKKSKYEELVAPKLDTIVCLYREGWTLAAVADFLGLSERRLCTYNKAKKKRLYDLPYNLIKTSILILL